MSHYCCDTDFRASDEEAETRRDEAGPSTAEVSSSRPRKLRARRPRAPSPVPPEVGDGGALDPGASLSPPRRARTAIELAELGQVRSMCLSAFIKLLCLIIIIKLLMFLMFSFMPDAIVEPDAL